MQVDKFRTVTTGTGQANPQTQMETQETGTAFSKTLNGVKTFIRLQAVTGTLLSIFAMLSHSTAVLEADYNIQSYERPDVCIHGGPISETDPGLLFRQGVLKIRNCSGSPAQEWHFKRAHNQMHSTADAYEIVNSATFATTSPKLHANVSGQLMVYWPEPVRLLPVTDLQVKAGKFNGVVGEHGVYLMQNTGNGTCYELTESTETVALEPCAPSLNKQMWRLVLVVYGDVRF